MNGYQIFFIGIIITLIGIIVNYCAIEETSVGFCEKIVRLDISNILFAYFLYGVSLALFMYVLGGTVQQALFDPASRCFNAITVFFAFVFTNSLLTFGKCGNDQNTLEAIFRWMIFLSIGIVVVRIFFSLGTL